MNDKLFCKMDLDDWEVLSLVYSVSPTATIMLLLTLLIFFPSLLTLIFAMQNSALYRHPARDLSFGNFKIAIPSVTLEKKTYIAFFFRFSKMLLGEV